LSFTEQPLTPSDAKPDMAMLRLIKESELRRGTIIGSGAFGTVYRVRNWHSIAKHVACVLLYGSLIMDTALVLLWLVKTANGKSFNCCLSAAAF